MEGGISTGGQGGDLFKSGSGQSSSSKYKQLGKLYVEGMKEFAKVFASLGIELNFEKGSPPPVLTVIEKLKAHLSKTY